MNVSYRSVPNIKNLINSHNQNVLNTSGLVNNNRNCRNKTNALLTGSAYLKEFTKQRFITKVQLNILTQKDYHLRQFSTNISLTLSLAKVRISIYLNI